MSRTYCLEKPNACCRSALADFGVSQSDGQPLEVDQSPGMRRWWPLRMDHLCFYFVRCQTCWTLFAIEWPEDSAAPLGASIINEEAERTILEAMYPGVNAKDADEGFLLTAMGVFARLGISKDAIEALLRSRYPGLCVLGGAR